MRGSSADLRRPWREKKKKNNKKKKKRKRKRRTERRRKIKYVWAKIQCKKLI